MPDHIAGEAYLADYLLYRLNLGWQSSSFFILGTNWPEYPKP